MIHTHSVETRPATGAFLLGGALGYLIGRRRGRILIDTSRNERGATLIAPYAIATSGLVSAPLAWDDLQRPIYPDQFDMQWAVARAATPSEKDAAVGAPQPSLQAVLARVRRRRSRRERAPL